MDKQFTNREKQFTNREICEKGKQVFFRNGKSSKGQIDQFEFAVLDFQKIPMPNGITIGDVQDLSEMSGYLRFYISTTRKDEAEYSKTESSDSTEVAKPNEIEKRAIDDTIVFGPSTSTPTSSVLADTLSISDTSLLSLGSDTSKSSLERMINDPLPSDIVAQAMALEAIGEQFHQGENHVQDSSVIEIRAHRGQVFPDMISFFKPVKIEMSNIYEMKMILPNGQEEAGEDNGGISEFWETFYDKCTLGETVRVPATIHTMKEEDWQSVCKVLYVGYRQQGFFPNRIALPFIKYCMTGDSKGASQDQLLSGFFDYLPEVDKATLTSALSEFESVDMDDLLTLLSTLDVRTQLSKHNIKTVLAEVAHKKPVQDPAFIADCWRPIFKEAICALLKCDITELYTSLRPTIKKVLLLLKFQEDLTPQQLETKSYLQRFIKSLSVPMLEKFLRFCTGSNVLVSESVTVRFIDATSEFSRRPVAHTCGCVLELPYSYQNYIEFRQEFTSVLESNIWIMDFI